MKILVVCQHYWPEPYPLPDVCEQLVLRGHRVDVVTGVPNYPLGRIYPGYKNRKNRDQFHNGVKIHRTFTIGRRNNVFFRFLNYFSFAFSSLFYVLGLKEEYDVVLANQTSPVMMAGAALAYGKKHGKKVVLYCLDLWPASLAAGGVRNGSLVYRVFEYISKRIYRAADTILVSSESFRGYLEQQFHIPPETILYHPQYSDVLCGPVRPVEKETVDLLFAGNIGVAQSVPTILRAAALLQEHRQLRWHIVGDGSELAHCRAMAEKMKLNNVVFHGRQDRAAMPKYFAMADAVLLTLVADPLLSLTLPGKTQAYMAAGKPIIGAANGEIPLVIERSGCGYCAAAEDAHALAEVVQSFMAAEDKEKLGRNAREYYETHFSRDQFMDRLEGVLSGRETVSCG